MLTKKSQAYTQIQNNLNRLINGIVVCIDPSIGSSSSMPGYAVYIAGELQSSGILPIDPTGSVPMRLQKLAYHMRRLYAEWDPDTLVYEEIPAQRYGGGNANAHASLLKAVGVILSISGPSGYVGLLPLSWKRMIRDTYVKGDREDAEEIGYIAIQQAKRISEEDPPKKYGRGKEKKKQSSN